MLQQGRQMPHVSSAEIRLDLLRLVIKVLK
jgi:hypothetical protein